MADRGSAGSNPAISIGEYAINGDVRTSYKSARHRDRPGETGDFEADLGGIMGVYCRAMYTPTRGERLYQVCVAIKEKGERMKLDPLIAVGKAATAVVSHFVVMGGRKK